jgi:short-subunit dehydrogenase
MTQKVVFITGASSGIGYATAQVFANAGYKVAGTARDVTRLKQLQDEIGENFLPIEADVRDPAATHQAVDAVVERFGRLDVVVANAGVGQRGGLIEAEWDHLETVLRTNIDGAMHTIRAGVPAMRANGGGHIVLLSSVTYNMTVPYAAIYAASKAFVSSIGRSLRMELAEDNIHVTDMIVGRTDTNFNSNRLGGGRTGDSVPRMSPDEVAKGILHGVENRRRAVYMRFFDRLTVLGNILIPDVIGRIALKQYK